MRFTWSEIKAAVNRDKHGVAFEEARTCFDDAGHIVLYDPDHSEEEDRELLIGHSSAGRLLIVSYTLRGSVIRIISARRATRREASTYAQGI
jgi:uncharacterized DUF497 family protein